MHHNVWQEIVVATSSEQPSWFKALPPPLWLTLLLFVISFSTAALIQWGRTAHGESLSWSQHVDQGLLNAFVTFAALELGILLFRADQLKKAMADQSRRLSALNRREHEIQWVSQNLYKIFRMYAHMDSPTHDAVSKALSRFIKNIEVSDAHIKVQGEYIVLASYRWFWEKVLEAQRAAKNADHRISVFATHSAPISFWRKPEFRPILDIQRRFVEAGGVLNRILIDRGSGFSLDELTLYAGIVNEMRRSGTDVPPARRNIFYLRTGADDEILDFMITRFDGEYYSIKWDPRYIGTKNSDIASCEFFTGESRFMEDFWDKWEHAVYAIRDKPDIGVSLTYKGLSEASAEVLASTPDSQELVAMLRLPR